MTLRDLLQGTALYGATEVLNRFLLFSLLPLFTRFLSPGDFGISAMVASLSVLLVPVISLGLGGGLAPCYFAKSEPSHRKSTIATAFALVGTSTLASLAVGIPAAEALSVGVFGSAEYAHFVVLGLLATGFTVLGIPFRQRLQFDKRAGLYATLSFLSAVITAGTTVVMLVVLGRGITGVLEANAIAQAATLILFAAPSLFTLAVRPRVELAHRLLSVGLPLVPAFGALFLLQHGSRYLLQWMVGLEAVGIYSVGQNIGLVVSVLVTGFQGAWVPFFMAYADKPAEAGVVLGRVTTYYVLGFGTFSLALYAAAKVIVVAMASPPFFEAWRVVGLSATTQFLGGVFLVLLPGMYYAGEVKYIGLVQGVAAVCSVVVTAFMILAFGLFGAALAMPLSYALLVGMQFLWNRRRRYVEVCYEWPRLKVFLGFYLLFAAATLVNRDLSLTGEAVLSLVGLSALALFALSCLEPGERRLLRVTAAGFLRTQAPAPASTGRGEVAAGRDAVGSRKAAS